MSGVCKVDITESSKTLKTLLAQQKTASGKERVQALYLLKTKQVETVQHLAVVMGRDRITVQRWLRLYRQGGLNALLEVKQSKGRPKIIPDWAIEQLQQELKVPEGFESYGEVQTWLKAVLGIEANYSVVYKLVRYKLQAKLKVPRPCSWEQDPKAIETFKKKLPQDLQLLISNAANPLGELEGIRYWCEDETHLGLKTVEHRLLTLKGVKPVGQVQWEREAYYIYGVVEPKTGESFFYEFSHLDTECFEEFLKQFYQEYPKNLHIIQLDNGSFHKAKRLRVPENIILLFQPPHCPELNPIERLWEHLKGFLSWRLFSNLDEIKNQVADILRSLSQEVIASLTGWEYILQALSVADI